MSSLQIGRLLVGPPLQWYEQLGDPVTTLGGAVVPNQRTAPEFSLGIGTYAADGQTDTPAARLRIRRQLRAMLNNSPMKLAGAFIYLIYSDDPENSGWYVPDQTQLQDYSGTSGLATGFWQLASSNWYVAGKRRTHREARSIWLKDLRTGLYARDTLGWIYSTDFSALTALPLSVLPNGATQAALTVTGQVVPETAMPTGRDGGVALQVEGLSDLEVVSFERPEAAFGLSDVIVYDRRGNTPTTGFYKTIVETDLPLSYWRLDETTGTNAADQMGVNALTYTGGYTLNQTPGALTGSGDTDACVLLNGSTGYLAGTTGQLQIASAITLEAWVNPSSNPAVSAIMGKHSSGSGYDLYVATGTVSFALNGTVVAGGTLTVGQWAHIVATWDGATMRVYVDGVQVASGAFAGPLTVSTNPFQLGSTGTGVNTFAGDLDEAAVYTYALTPSQVLNHYGAAIAPYGSGVAPQTYLGWEEVPGTDYAWSWDTTGGAQDCPVIENGLVRVRWDSTNTPGFRVDVWTGVYWQEQGKMLVFRVGDSNNYDNTWVAASLVEYTPDRTVAQVVMSNTTDSYSRERVFITMQRGEFGVTFESYPAPKAGTLADCVLVWSLYPDSVPANCNDSVAKDDTQSGLGIPASPQNSGPSPCATISTAFGVGHSGLFSTQTIGASSFSISENWVGILRCTGGLAAVGPYQHTLSVLQGANAYAQATSGTQAYGSSANEVTVESQNGAGYVNAGLSFAAAVSSQVAEAEAIRNTGSTTTSQVSDTSASGGLSVKDVQASAGNFTLIQSSPTFLNGTYRCLARVKVDSGVTGSFKWTANGIYGDTVTCTSTSWVWIDLGEGTATGSSFDVTAWGGNGSTTGIYIDRVETYLIQDRTRAAAIYSGARDQAQAALYDARTIGALVAR